MKYSYIFNGDVFMDEVEVEFGMFRTLMLDGVGGEVYGVNVVIIDKGVPYQRIMQFLEYLTKLCRFGDAVSYSAVYGFGVRAENGQLPFRRLRDKIIVKEYGEVRCGSTRVGISGAVSVDEVDGYKLSKKEVEVGGVPEVLQDFFYDGEMWFSRDVYMDVYLLDSVGDVWLGEDEVLQCFSKILVTGGISYRGASEEEVLF